ncbi:hypothetical protein A2U01_0043267, partial [Trifolium medium]|nr:hypothetical protein [Trifolium medium]
LLLILWTHDNSSSGMYSAIKSGYTHSSSVLHR